MPDIESIPDNLVRPDSDPNILTLSLDGEPDITLTLAEARDLITMALTIPSLTERIARLEKLRGTSR